MLRRGGLKVGGFTCRFGDPEAEALVPVLDVEPDLLTLMTVVARGDGLPPARARAQGVCVTTVLAAANYPETPRMGDVISIGEAAPGVVVFHAGTARDAGGQLVTAGGRVLAISAVGATMVDARRRGAEAADGIRFAGMQRRSDIGWREIGRASGN